MFTFLEPEEACQPPFVAFGSLLIKPERWCAILVGLLIDVTMLIVGDC